MLSRRLLLNVDEIAAVIEGIESILPITEVRFEGWVEIWKRCVMLERGLWDVVISSVS